MRASSLPRAAITRRGSSTAAPSPPRSARNGSGSSTLSPKRATAAVSRRLRPTVNVSGHLTFGSGMPLPGFYRFDGDHYVLSSLRNQVVAPVYQRTDLRINKELTRRRFDATLFAEVINVTNHTNQDFDSPGPYDPATGRTAPNFFTMLPVLPSLGLVVRFGAHQSSAQ